MIALDIDGTITFGRQDVPKVVSDKLEALSKEGWTIVLITGRTFRWAFHSVRYLSFSYHLIVQNGATMLKMPAQEIRERRYLDRKIFPVMDEICRDQPGDYVVYSGIEGGDRCYYRPDNFSPPLQDYIKRREAGLGEELIAVSSFDGFNHDQFGSIKCFGTREDMKTVQQRVCERLCLHAPVIRDPYRDDDFCVLQITHAKACKRHALEDFITRVNSKGPIIVAGDDYNDEGMLELADVKIVMETAPGPLKEKADILAGPAEKFGIIKALEQAIHIVNKEKVYE